MRYMLLVYSPESAWTKEEWLACTQESLGVCGELQAKGEFIAASPLHPVATATTIRVRQGQTVVTAGPFAETVEQLGGYFLIEVSDLDAAIDVAVRLPAARKGTVEIRPVYPLAGLPAERFSEEKQNAPSYMLLCYDDPRAWEELGEKELRGAQAEGAELAQRLATRHQYLSAAPLHGVSTATSVRIRAGQRLITDGPFAETHEFLGGYYLIVPRDLNEAIQIATQHPGARVGSVEIRKVYDLSSS